MKAPAKLTLNLRVTGVRTDGFHLIDAEMVSLDIADDITIEECNGPSSLTIDGPFSDGLANDASNLVLRALSLALVCVAPLCTLLPMLVAPTRNCML